MTDPRDLEAALAAMDPDKAEDLVTYMPYRVVATKAELIAEGRALLGALDILTD